MVKALSLREVVHFYTLVRVPGKIERYRLKLLDKNGCDSKDLAWRLQEYYRHISGSLIEITENMRDENGNLHIPAGNDKLVIRDITGKIEIDYSAKPAFFIVVSWRGKNQYDKQFRWLVALPKLVYFEELPNAPYCDDDDEDDDDY